MTVPSERKLLDEAKKQQLALTQGQQANVPKFPTRYIGVTDNQLMTTGGGKKLSGTVTAGTSTVSTGSYLNAAVPKAPKDLGQIPADALPDLSEDVEGQSVDTAQITPEAQEAIQIDFDKDVGEAELTQDQLAQAQTIEGDEFDERATTQYQLGQLLSSIEEGKPMPAWAAPAVRKVAGIMQARGLGASSMAAAAMTQAVMESGVVIAAKDADQYAKVQLANLNNRQQTALANAAAIAGLEKANLGARMQSAVTNAQTLLATETKNLDAQQQSNVLEFNALTQALFKDAAEENARIQMNAKNEIQVEEFFAELGSQVETANKNRRAAVDQFNAGERNAQNQFNAAMKDNRQKFNANMQYAIDQSNVQWRREVNTINTAAQNENNRINAQNLFNASQNSLNNLWQTYRDNASWSFQKAENMLQRQHEVGIMAMEFANTKELYSQKQKDELAQGIGNWLAIWYANSD
jgi:hypothetical protein